MALTPNIFCTSNVDLATFLVFEGIKLLEFEVTDAYRKIVTIKFIDEKQNCLDLERVFLNSDLKRYREINKWVLKNIHAKLRENNKE